MSWTAEEIIAILANPTGTTVLNGKSYPNSFIIYRLLQRFIAEGQTADEQSSKSTHHENHVGCNGSDAFILTDIAQKSAAYMKANPKNPYGLSKKQAEFVAKKLKKYVKTQLVGMVQNMMSQPTAVAASATATPTVSENVNFAKETLKDWPPKMREDIVRRVAEKSIVASRPPQVTQKPSRPVITGLQKNVPSDAEVEKMVDWKKGNEPENYFMDGELSETEARAFWFRRFKAHPLKKEEMY